MKRVTPPPKLRGDQFVDWMTSVPTAELAAFVRRANADYLYWDQIKRKTPPPPLSSVQAWWALKMSRQLNARFLPLADASGKPFRYWLPDSFAEVLKEIDQKAAGTVLTQPDGGDVLNESVRRQVVIKSLMEEAIATSQVEGAVTTRAKAKEMLRSKRAPQDRDEHMIYNSYRTMNMLRRISNQPLSTQLLHEIQSTITANTLDDSSKAGQFRLREDEVVVMNDDGEVVFVPPEASLLPERIDRLIEFTNRDHSGPDFIHPLVKAAILHFWLAYEHPYVDGNGRTARALFYWFMLKQKYWLFEYLTISKIVHRAKAQYAMSFLYSEMDSNDLTYSLHHMLRVTQKSIVDLVERLQHLQVKHRRMADAVRRYPGLNARQRILLNYAVDHPDEILTIKAHQTSQGVTYESARMDFLNLVKRRLLIKRRMGKQLIFLAASNLSDRLR